MTDDDFLARLEDGSLPAEAFRHRDHLRAGYLYVHRLGFAGAIAAISQALRGFAAAKGKPGLYHETITVAFIALIHRHYAEDGCGGDFVAFTSRHPDLFKPGLLERFYPPGQLTGAEAKAVFVLPDRERFANTE